MKTMKKNILFSAITITLLLCSNLSFSQTPNGTLNLGILTSFEAYTGAGGVTNSGGTVTGDVGTHFGIISGLELPSYTGNKYNADAVTDQARKDLLRLYIHLNDKFVDFPGTHAPAFGAGETILPGVYSIPGAGSVGAALTLDGGGDPDAFFVIKFNGAFTVGAGATVTLTNGARSCNVFWIVDGAISVAASANIKGTLFAKTGAVGLGADVVLEGRMFTMDGAITFGIGAIASPPPCVSTIQIFCEADCTPAPAVDVLGVLSDFALFTNSGAVANTGISGINGKIGTNAGTISGYTTGVHIGTEHAADALTAQAALDLDAAYTALMAIPNTVLSHTPAFGTGETITAGVYYIGAAGSLAGTITLDGQNNPDAIFVFKFAGAFSVGAQSKIILANGARRCNVFWIGGAGVPTGAVSIGAASVLKGTFLSHGGACSSGAGVFLAGRQLSTGGAVNTYSGIIYTNPECVTSISIGGPNAVNDNASTNLNTPVNITVLANDIPGAAALDPASVTIVAGTQPNTSTVGVFTVNSVTGVVTFTPVTGFVGVATANYNVCDLNNLCDVATITVNVIDGGTNLYPALGFGTLAFEDLWPSKGDYDFNDLILDYQFEITTNTSNFVESVKGTFIIKAFGGSFENGFGFQLANAINPIDITVTGSRLTENIITLNGNGTEAGQTIPTIIVYDNAFAQMTHPGMGIGVNTDEVAPYVTPVTIVIDMVFEPNTYSYNDLDIANFNPFLIVNKDRSVEVHLPDYAPTALADQLLFGTYADDSNPATGKYYKTTNNLPWAINIYESFDYPIEKQQIVWAYLKFATWGISGGTTFEDWYKDLTGYRNSTLIYTIPVK